MWTSGTFIIRSGSDYGRSFMNFCPLPLLKPCCMTIISIIGGAGMAEKLNYFPTAIHEPAKNGLCIAQLDSPQDLGRLLRERSFPGCVATSAFSCPVGTLSHASRLPFTPVLHSIVRWKTRSGEPGQVLRIGYFETRTRFTAYAAWT